MSRRPSSSTSRIYSIDHSSTHPCIWHKHCTSLCAWNSLSCLFFLLFLFLKRKFIRQASRQCQRALDPHTDCRTRCHCLFVAWLHLKCYCGERRTRKTLAFVKHRCASVRALVGLLPAFRWLFSEKEMKLSNRLAAPASFRTFGAPSSDISQLIGQISCIWLIFHRSNVNVSRVRISAQFHAHYRVPVYACVLVRGLMCSPKENRTTTLLVDRLQFSQSFFIKSRAREFSRSLRQPLKKHT